MEDLQARANEIWKRSGRCPICQKTPQVFDEDGIYTHLLEHRVKFLEKVIKLYCDCDCDKPPKPGESHWQFCRRRIADNALEGTIEQMIPGVPK